MGALIRLDERSFWRSSLLQGLNFVVHGVSTREGGVSKSPFASLNVGLHVGDLREDVLCNRAIVLKYFGFFPTETVCCEQVHGTAVREVSRADAGRGAFNHEETIQGVDALITSTSNLALMGYFADCTPIFFADAEGKWVGLAHAGWRGTLHGIARNVVKELEERGVSSERLYVALGPRIGPCCYEVGDDLALAFREKFGSQVVHRSGRDRPTVDMAAANVHLLKELGVRKECIDIADECTACHTKRYFSHRAEGPITGRMAAIIALSR